MKKYLLFCFGFMIAYGLFTVGSNGTSGFEYPALGWAFFAQGAGAGIGAMIVGCLGLLYEPNRFKGFMLATLAIGILVPLSKFLA